MQSFRERCGYHSNQQNIQPPSQDSSRLENYRHQSQPGLNCERQRMLAKEYYTQQTFQGFENSAVDKYHRTSKPLLGQQLQVRPTFPAYGAVQENSTFPAQYSGEEGLQNWGSPQQALAAGVAKYEETLIKKAAVPADGRQYQEQTTQLPFPAHPLHLPQQQTVVSYPKLQRQKIQSEVSSFSQTSHFTQHSQSFPPTSTYSAVQGHAVHTYKSCSAPSTQPQERPLASGNMASGQRVQSLHGFQPSRISYDQQQSLQSRHHGQETLHYQNLSKYQHYNQQSQTYCQSDAQVRTPEQYYQAFSPPSSSHSPVRSVGRSPSYSSTPSPLMPNLENFQYNQQPLNTGAFPAAITDHSHFMPLLNPSPTDTSSPDHHPGNCKNLQKDKLTENILSDLSMQSLNALTSQVENITVQQLLLSKSGMPQKKSIKNPPRTPEQLKGQHCSPENNTYSMDKIGTPVSETHGTPQSAHNEAQDNEYLSGSEDPMERGYLFCDPSRSPAKANHSKMKPESISTRSVESQDNLSVKSDDSFQSINATLPLDSFGKYVGNDGECPRLLVNALSQDELSSEIIALQDAINSEKTDKAWEMKLLTCNVRSPRIGVGEQFKIVEPCMKNSMKEITASSASKEPAKSHFHLENNSTCLDAVVKRAWPSPEDHRAHNDTLKLKKAAVGNNCTDLSKETFESTRAEYLTAETKKVCPVASTLDYSSKISLPTTTSSSSYGCYSNSMTNAMSTKNAEAFGWLDKSINESCLRWKELEMSLNLSEPEKDLTRLNKEQKSLCRNEEPSSQNEPGEQLHKTKEMVEDEEISYLGENKAANERWLEDERNFCADSEFQDISLIGSPDVKVSDLEQGEYSPLCDISSTDRKSTMDDAASSRSMEKAQMSSIEQAPESPAEDRTMDAKENSVPASQLTSQSVMLLGPVIGTESKVKSWFGSSLPHAEDEEEVNANEGTEKEADMVVSKTTVVEDLNSQIVPESTLKMNMDDLSESKSPQSTKIHSCVLDGDEFRESLPDLSKNVQAFAAVSDHSIVHVGQTQIQAPNKSVTQTTNRQTPVKSVDQTTYMQAPMKGVDETTHIQSPMKSVDQTTHIQAAMKSEDKTLDVQDPMTSVDQSIHNQALMRSVDQTTHIHAPMECDLITRHIQCPIKSGDETGHIQAPMRSVNKMTNTEVAMKSVAPTTHMQNPIIDATQTGHIQGPIENADETRHTHASMENEDKITQILAPTESVQQTGLIQASVKSVNQFVYIQVGKERLDQTTDIQMPKESVDETMHIQISVKSVHQTTNIQAPLESLNQTVHIQAPNECVHHISDTDGPMKNVHQSSHIKAPAESGYTTACTQAPVESKDKTAHIHPQMESEHKTHIQAPIESVAQTTHSQTPMESNDKTTHIYMECKDQKVHIEAPTMNNSGPMQSGAKTTHIQLPMESEDQTAHIQAPMKSAAQSMPIHVPMESENKTTHIQAPIESEDKSAHMQAAMESEDKPAHIQAQKENKDQTTNIQAPMKSVDETELIQTQTESVHQVTDILAPKLRVPHITGIQAPIISVNETVDIQSRTESVHEIADIQAPMKSVHHVAGMLTPMESEEQTAGQEAPKKSVDDTVCIQTPTESAHQIADIQAPMKSVPQTVPMKAAIKSMHQTAEVPVLKECVHQINDLRVPVESKDTTTHIQTPTESVDQTALIQTQKESVDQITLIQAPIESTSQRVCTQVLPFATTGPPVRMCTRSFTAKGEPRAGGPYMGKLAKRVANGLKQRAAFKARLLDGMLLPQATKTPDSDISAVLVPSPILDSDSANQKVKSPDDQLISDKNQQSMILRSRTKTQDIFHMKKRREKGVTDARLKNCKVTKKMGPKSRFPTSTFKLACCDVQKAQGASKGPKLPKSSIGGKPTERGHHPLKRKSSLISPIPAKKRNLMMRRNASAKGQKQRPPPHLFKKIALVKRENPKLSLNVPRKGGARNAAGKGPPGVCLKIRSCAQGGTKTKVLPPRKGRGLKLEAIVQKITSPQLKKLAGSAAASAHADDLLGAPPPEKERALRNASASTAVGETGRPLGGQAATHRAPGAEQLCRNTNRPLKGKLANGKRLSTGSSEGEACSSPETGGSMGVHSMVAQSPGKRNRRGRPLLAGLALAADSQDQPACLSPAALRQAARDKMERRREGGQAGSDDEDSDGEEITEGKLSQGRVRKRVNHATFNGYSKRQRKGLSPSKAKSKAKSRKCRANRRQAPIVCPTEPEIRLKYLSCKPLPRGESRAKPFSPYVQVVRKDAFSTVCTVINSPAEELVLHQVECFSPTGTPYTPAGVRPTLPSSSAMKLGPLVSKALPVTCLMCCLCRNPSNHRDLGDLCGPYYPEDCLPKKKSRLKEKIMKAEGMSELPLLPPDRTPRAIESSCAAIVAASGKHPELDIVGADSAKQMLRSSTRGLYRKLQSCYCCDGRAEGEEAEKSRRHQCSKASLVSPSHEPAAETQEHWVHEACAIWTRGVYLVGGKLYGLHEAADLAAKVVCPVCQQAGASVSCCHKGCAQTYHFTCANDLGCLLSEDNFSLRCLKHKRQFL